MVCVVSHVLCMYICFSPPQSTNIHVTVVPWVSRVYEICTLSEVICIPAPREYI